MGGGTQETTWRAGAHSAIVHITIHYVGIQKKRKKSAQKQGREREDSELAVGDSEHEGREAGATGRAAGRRWRALPWARVMG